MIESLISLTRSLERGVKIILSWLESKRGSPTRRAKFVDLAPTDKADNAGVYSEAILFAINNTKVSNIALTGPYGSGKSSIIKSFLKNYRRPVLHISLAAFVPEVDSQSKKVSRQEIERSILQQMLYGADANRLPLSRFKRIQKPSVWSKFKSFYITLGSLAIWYIFSRRDDVLSGSFFSPFALSNGLNIVICAFAVVFLWAVLHHFYVASLGLSLKSISLKDVEIRPAYDDQTSILNRHLDEIIYFFQSTNYDLVIIEDLDRFNEAEIFVTLREINSLVNENSGVKRTIKFLYALRDDMFVNTDRTKFFEFIIPVIPIINTSNSIDMVLRQGRRLEIDGRLDRQFLREISRYLNDLRLIQNIFNEYAIYVANLETDGDSLLDANKLLAILVYKNVYPNDFEQLHRGAGNLAEILSCQEDLIRQGEDRYRAEIVELEKRIETAEQQTPSDLKELRQIYAMALLEKMPAETSYISQDRSVWIPTTQLACHDAFEQLIEAPRVYPRSVNNGYNYIEISKIQSEVAPQKSYLQRKGEIESKLADNKNKMLRRINELRLAIPALRMSKLRELLRLNHDRIEDLFKGFKENGNLARFLILEGHLDDTYYHYISLFHLGRLSPSDNKFLIKIRAFVTPEPNFPIDNPKEIIAAMRAEDFRQSYVLNIKIVDSLLNSQDLYPEQIRKLFYLLSSEFEACESFLANYYSSGQNVVGLLLGLEKAWKNLVPAALASPNNIFHITQLIASLPVSLLKTLAKNFETLPEFVAEYLPEILAILPELAPERLECIGFKVKSLAAIKGHSEIVRFMFEKELYELTFSNLEYVYQNILAQDDTTSFRERNFTTIRSINNTFLMSKLEREFVLYFRVILLELQENSKEDMGAILAILRHGTLDQSDLRKFVEMQTTRLSNLEEVPEKLYAMLFELNSIEPTWMNCLIFMKADGFEAGSLIGYLGLYDVRMALLKHPMPSDTETEVLRNFLIEADSLSDTAYRDYVRALSNQFDNFPEELGNTKIQTLIIEKKIAFSNKNIEALSGCRDLQVLFVATNIYKYLADSDSFEIDDDFRESLLRSNIDDLSKVEVVDLMDLDALAALPERAALIGPIIVNVDDRRFKIEEGGAQALVINSRPITTQISLFNKYHPLMSDDQIRRILTTLPEPFSEIKTGFHTPRLESNPENQMLVRWLDSRKIISSWSEVRYLSNHVIKINLYRPG